MKYKITTYILIFMLFTLISCRKNYTYDKEFDRNISYVENAPHIYLSNNPITTPIHINDKKEATEFLLYALAQNYINEDCLPSKKLILKSIGIFRQEHLAQQELEALYLLSEICKSRNDIDSVTTVIQDAIHTARRIDDKTWLFYLHYHLSKLYLSELNSHMFAKHQTLANKYIQEIDPCDLSISTKILIAENFINLRQYRECYEKLLEIESVISPQNAFYNKMKRLQGIVLYKMQEWDSSIRIMEGLTNNENSNKNKFTCHSILSYCYYHKQDFNNAKKHKDLAIKYDIYNINNFEKIEFYDFCARLAEIEHNKEEQLKWLILLDDQHKDIIENINSQSLDKAIQSYTSRLEKKLFREKLKTYRFIVWGLLISLFIGFIIHIKKKKKQLLQIFALQQQIDSLEQLRNIKDEVRNFIFRDFEIAKKIAMLRATQQVQSVKFLKDLERYHITKNNDLLDTDWERFYKHINLTFDGFHSKLRNEYPTLNEKEIQLCCLLISDFKTEEIAAIWINSIFSVHKYKTNVRKKINAPEGADIIAFLKEKLSLQ